MSSSFFQQIPAKIGQHYLKKRIGKIWKRSKEKLHERQYASYQDYVEHQKAKFTYKSICPMDLDDHEQRYHHVLRERLLASGLVQGGAALCLGARQGTEVKSFLECGCFAVGIDLNPGHNNLLVLPGDFHAIQFSADSVDMVFSNSLDHAFDLQKLLGEVVRVLKKGGLFILEAPIGTEEGGSTGFYESMYWNTVDALLEKINRAGFQTLSRQSIDYPFYGESIFLRLVDKPAPASA